jgi:hypothetical protein
LWSEVTAVGGNAVGRVRRMSVRSATARNKVPAGWFVRRVNVEAGRMRRHWYRSSKLARADRHLSSHDIKKGKLAAPRNGGRTACAILSGRDATRRQ